jgi:hypothetical protein
VIELIPVSGAIESALLELRHRPCRERRSAGERSRGRDAEIGRHAGCRIRDLCDVVGRVAVAVQIRTVLGELAREEDDLPPDARHRAVEERDRDARAAHEDIVVVVFVTATARAEEANAPNDHTQQKSPHARFLSF